MLNLGDLADIVVKDRACICSVYANLKTDLSIMPAEGAKVLATRGGGGC
jgi:hypothetical protein